MRDAVVDEVLVRCDRVVVVARPTLAGLTSTERVVAGLPDPRRAALVLRGPGLDADEVGRVLTDARCWPGWATSAGSPRRSTSGSGRCARGAARSARAAREVLAESPAPASTPA